MEGVLRGVLRGVLLGDRWVSVALGGVPILADALGLDLEIPMSSMIFPSIELDWLKLKPRPVVPSPGPRDPRNPLSEPADSRCPGDFTGDMSGIPEVL